MACVSVCECIKCNSVITLAFQIHIVIVILINDNTQQSANESVLFSKIISIFFSLFSVHWKRYLIKKMEDRGELLGLLLWAMISNNKEMILRCQQKSSDGLFSLNMRTNLERNTCFSNAPKNDQT